LQNAGPIEYTGTMEYNPVDMPESILGGYRLMGWDPELYGTTQVWFTDESQMFVAEWGQSQG